MTRILVIDDDPAIRSVIGDALRQDGYQVDAAANGQQALAAFGKHRPDALVLDLEMPARARSAQPRLALDWALGRV